MTQTAAEVFCQSAAPGGHLAAVLSTSDAKVIDEIAANAGRSIWMGGSAWGAERTWSWADGSKMTYTQWAEGEPSTGSDCMAAAHSIGETSLAWSASPCSLLKPFVCESASEVLTGIVRRDVGRNGSDGDAVFRASEEDDDRVITTDAPLIASKAEEDDDVVRTTDAPETTHRKIPETEEYDDQVFTTDAPGTTTSTSSSTTTSTSSSTSTSTSSSTSTTTSTSTSTATSSDTSRLPAKHLVSKQNKVQQSLLRAFFFPPTRVI